jgi:hypothetical protein
MLPTRRDYCEGASGSNSPGGAGNGYLPADGYARGTRHECVEADGTRIAQGIVARPLLTALGDNVVDSLAVAEPFPARLKRRRLKLP